MKNTGAIRNPLLRLSLDDDELIVDNFAGGGGASTAMEQALGRKIDIAINHDPEALAMHRVNHPETKHFLDSVWNVDIEKEVGGRRVGVAWFSPDCTDFSAAKGGTPVRRNIRGLAWVVLRWARKVRPRVIFLENVPEFQMWGPVIQVKKRGKPLHNEDGSPVLVANKKKRGLTFKRWCSNLRSLGYELEVRQLRACKYGAPTLRNRLFIVARCDGQPIAWPEETHGEAPTLFRDLKPYRTAAECIDWTLPCPSIFLTREEGRALGIRRPLAEATMRRIARGVMRYVVNNPRPFIVNLTHGVRLESVDEPFKTITGARRGEKALVVPHITRFNQNGIGHEVTEPLSTITSKGSQQALVASHLIKLKGTCRDGQPSDAPLATICGGGTHVAEVRAFLIKYFGTDQDPRLEEPMHTVTAKHRFGLVYVYGEPYQIVDIGMRMLTPRELFRAQGFPSDYVIERGIDESGKAIPLTKTAQVRMCGNSVSPPPAAALVRANFAGDAAAIESVA